VQVYYTDLSPQAYKHNDLIYIYIISKIEKIFLKGKYCDVIIITFSLVNDKCANYIKMIEMETLIVSPTLQN
jgi:hypothetical protein